MTRRGKSDQQIRSKKNHIKTRSDCTQQTQGHGNKKIVASDSSKAIGRNSVPPESNQKTSNAASRESPAHNKNTLQSQRLGREKQSEIKETNKEMQNRRVNSPTSNRSVISRHWHPGKPGRRKPRSNKIRPAKPRGKCNH